jgi:sulfatase maturation enzyme AslB (radical SAM superfamily)
MKIGIHQPRISYYVGRTEETYDLFRKDFQNKGTFKKVLEGLISLEEVLAITAKY